ncbi:hypothetical protein V6N13_059366 [Hibiscus sabdariffa]
MFGARCCLIRPRITNVWKSSIAISRGNPQRCNESEGPTTGVYTSHTGLDFKLRASWYNRRGRLPSQHLDPALPKLFWFTPTFPTCPTVAEQFLDIKRTSPEGNFNVADFPSFAISFATAPAALANCPPLPSVISMLCMAEDSIKDLIENLQQLAKQRLREKREEKKDSYTDMVYSKNTFGTILTISQRLSFSEFPFTDPIFYGIDPLQEYVELSMSGSTGERSFADIITSIRYWVIHSITIPFFL